MRAAFFFDFFSETLNKIFLNEGNKYKEIFYNNLGEKDKKELKEIEERIIKLFDYEKDLWKKVSGGLKVSDGEIKKYWEMKSADSLFYGRITKIFTKNKDFTIPIYIYTRILDLVLDIKEYESDIREKLPNILYIRLSQKMFIKQIPKNKKDALEQAKHLGIYSELKLSIKKLIKKIETFNFENYEFLKKRIKQKNEEFDKEFKLN